MISPETTATVFTKKFLCEHCGFHHCGNGCSFHDEKRVYHGRSLDCLAKPNWIYHCRISKQTYNDRAKDAGKQCFFYKWRIRAERDSIQVIRFRAIRQCYVTLNKNLNPFRRSRYINHFSAGVNEAVAELKDQES